ncbi:hypothetical protein C1Y63_09910 [Corynebacterium sp. 13CS0277]|uniref:mechanosensitive ion channel family protein n=1 Tax=Corynebacterium sp. 13CS0277 TaxID=2071994 RepID=UPI000D0423AC|nr:mechanosensitive ion channel family protein [Corynebacterium sp. 13CS0277]PRQ10761.1 hypothetical protein C1Y63_09910 [Corynebacterium sp. 13CS0277]
MLIPVETLARQWWAWAITDGVTLLIITVLALLVPRVGRFAVTVFQSRLDATAQESKSKLAIFSTVMYLLQLVAYFLLLVAFLKVLGFSLVGAAIPATVISAAVGLGAQSVIADFLAGFFVLQEKQFGVGDWVQFKGNGVDVQGDVIQMTMRATKVRTLAGETVLVPNSAARVCINHSNYWARAVAVVPVPLLGSTSIDEAISRAAAAAQRALERPDIAPDVRGELDVHPAVAIEKPTVVGMPWLADMRFVVQVNPARQWVVERAIRTAILDEFWSEYGSATTTSGALRRQLATVTDEPGTRPVTARTPLVERGELGGFNDPAPDPRWRRSADAEARHTLRESDELPGADPETILMDATGGEGASRRGAGVLGTGGASGYYARTPRVDVPIAGDGQESNPYAADADAEAPAYGEPGPTRGAHELADVDEHHESARGDVHVRDPKKPARATAQPQEPQSKIPGAKYLSFGWRLRPSTTLLLIALVVLTIIRGLTLETDEEYPDGAWAPKRTTAATSAPAPAETTEEEVSTPEPTSLLPEPSEAPSAAPAPSSAPAEEEEPAEEPEASTAPSDEPSELPEDNEPPASISPTQAPEEPRPADGGGDTAAPAENPGTLPAAPAEAPART